MRDLGPLDREPRSIRPPFDQPCNVYPDRGDRLVALRDALAGVELGDYDQRIIAWLAGSDVATVGTVVSWLHRVRHADETAP